MPVSYKNILITPNIGSNTADPTIQLAGGNTSANTDVFMRVYPLSNGTVSFEGSAGQLFSITNDMANVVFSVGDVSGIPLIQAFANSRVSILPITNTFNINATSVSLGSNIALVANGSTGTNGQVLTSNGSAVYWASAAAGVNTAAQYSWTNTHTFSSNLTVNAASLLVSNATTVSTINTTGIYVGNTTTNVVIANTTSTFGGNVVITGTANAANVTAAIFTGNLTGTASNSTNLNGQPASFYTNATNLSTGTLDNGRLSSAVVNTSGAFTFSGLQTFQSNVHVGNSTVNTRISGTTTTLANSTFTTTLTLGTSSFGGNVTISGTANVSANLVVGASGELIISNGAGIEANGSFGSSGQVLTSSGTGVYWSAAAAGVNTAAQYSWTNTHSFSANVTMTGWLDLESFVETDATPAISAGTLTLDLATAQVFDVSLNSSVTTLTINNVPATASKVTSFTLTLTADGTARTVAWPAAFRWPGNTAPTITSTLNKRDVFVFFTTDNGTSWNAFISGQNL